ncbi:MAG: hypothetical protein ACFE7R_06210 [Candidatus Hodarchaeota archaeon]
MSLRTRINSLILVCTVLIYLTTYYVGLVVIPLSLDTKEPLTILIGGLAGITLIGALGRRNEQSESVRHKPVVIIILCAIGIMVTIALTLVDFRPPGMDPEVPFLFAIPPLTLVIGLAVLIEELVLWLKIDQPQLEKRQIFGIKKTEQ